MRTLLKRLRGVVGAGVSWSMSWAVVGAAFGFVQGQLNPEVWQFSNPMLQQALGFGIFGLLAGTIFGAVLAVVERGKNVEELSKVRMGSLGASANVALVVLIGLFWARDPTPMSWVYMILTGATLGAISPVFTLWLAKRTSSVVSALEEVTDGNRGLVSEAPLEFDDLDRSEHERAKVPTQ